MKRATALGEATQGQPSGEVRHRWMAGPNEGEWRHSLTSRNKSRVTSGPDQQSSIAQSVERQIEVLGAPVQLRFEEPAEMAEWTIAAACKVAGLAAYRGSNPLLGTTGGSSIGRAGLS